MTKTEYDDIDKYIDATKSIGSYSKVKVNCSANTLKKLLYSTFIILFIF